MSLSHSGNSILNDKSPNLTVECHKFISYHPKDSLRKHSSSQVCHCGQYWGISALASSCLKKQNLDRLENSSIYNEEWRKNPIQKYKVCSLWMNKKFNLPLVSVLSRWLCWLDKKAAACFREQIQGVFHRGEYQTNHFNRYWSSLIFPSLSLYV